MIATRKKYYAKIYEHFSDTNKVKKSTKRLKIAILSGIISLILIVIIIKTLPLTYLNYESLIVYASIVSLVLFLSALLLRHFLLVYFSYLNFLKLTLRKNYSSNYSPFVSIITPAFNEGKLIKNILENLLQLDYKNYEIIVVDDGSTDNTKEIVEQMVGFNEGKYGKVKISLMSQENCGKARALNAGIKLAKGDFVLCMDGDSILSSDVIKVSIPYFKDPKIGAVAGNVKILNRNKILTKLQALEYIEGLNLSRSSQSFFKAVGIIPGPIGIFRKKALESVNYYSSDTFAEDADLSLKLISAKWKTVYEPKAIAYTEAPETFNQLLKQRYRWTRGILQSLSKHKSVFLNPVGNFKVFVLMWIMFYEAILWPVMNIFANLFFIFVAFTYGLSNLLFFWWLSLTTLDIMTAIYCVVLEKEDLKLAFYAPVYRIVFALLIDVTKAMATIEEYLGFRMKWGKLRRLGYNLNLVNN